MVFHDEYLDRLTGPDGPSAGPRTAGRAWRHRAHGLGTRRSRRCARFWRSWRGPRAAPDRGEGPGRRHGPDRSGGSRRPWPRRSDGYEGPVAVMSFNPHSVAAMRALRRRRSRAGSRPRRPTKGLARGADGPRRGGRSCAASPTSTGSARRSSATRPADLGRPSVAELKAAGVPASSAGRSGRPRPRPRRGGSRRHVTFEGYLPPCPA